MRVNEVVTEDSAKGIISDKKVNESSLALSLQSYKAAIDSITRQIQAGTVDRKKALEKIAEYRAKIKTTTEYYRKRQDNSSNAA